MIYWLLGFLMAVIVVGSIVDQQVHRFRLRRFIRDGDILAALRQHARMYAGDNPEDGDNTPFFFHYLNECLRVQLTQAVVGHLEDCDAVGINWALKNSVSHCLAPDDRQRLERRLAELTG